MGKRAFSEKVLELPECRHANHADKILMHIEKVQNV
jgi:hypothetical protein